MRVLIFSCLFLISLQANANRTPVHHIESQKSLLNESDLAKETEAYILAPYIPYFFVKTDDSCGTIWSNFRQWLKVDEIDRNSGIDYQFIMTWNCENDTDGFQKVYLEGVFEARTEAAKPILKKHIERIQKTPFYDDAYEFRRPYKKGLKLALEGWHDNLSGPYLHIYEVALENVNATVQINMDFTEALASSDKEKHLSQFIKKYFGNSKRDHFLDKIIPQIDAIRIGEERLYFLNNNQVHSVWHVTPGETYRCSGIGECLN